MSRRLSILPEEREDSPSPSSISQTSISSPITQLNSANVTEDMCNTVPLSLYSPSRNTGSYSTPRASIAMSPPYDAALHSMSPPVDAALHSMSPPVDAALHSISPPYDAALQSMSPPCDTVIHSTYSTAHFSNTTPADGGTLRDAATEARPAADSALKQVHYPSQCVEESPSRLKELLAIGAGNVEYVEEKSRNITTVMSDLPNEDEKTETFANFKPSTEGKEPMVTSGLIDLTYSDDSMVPADLCSSPTNNNSPLLSPSSITSQMLALTSPVSPFSASPSPRTPSLLTATPDSCAQETFFNSELPTQPTSNKTGCAVKSSTTHSSSGNFNLKCVPNESKKETVKYTFSDPSPQALTLYEHPVVTARRLEHFRSCSQGVDSGYCEDITTPLTCETQLTNCPEIHDATEEDSEPLIKRNHSVEDSLDTLESENNKPFYSSLPSVPLSQCRPLQLSKPYTKLVNQLSDEDKPSIEVSDVSPSSKSPVMKFIKSEEKESRRDSLTLPTAAWALFKRRRSSSATNEPSPLSSPVYCTPPDTSPWGSPRMSLDLQDAITSSSETITPYQTPRPSFSLDVSPLARDSACTCQCDRSKLKTLFRNSPFLSPRKGLVVSATELDKERTSPEDLLKLIEDEDSKISSAPATPYSTPQPSPTDYVMQVWQNATTGS